MCGKVASCASVLTNCIVVVPLLGSKSLTVMPRVTVSVGWRYARVLVCLREISSATALHRYLHDAFLISGYRVQVGATCKIYTRTSQAPMDRSIVLGSARTDRR